MLVIQFSFFTSPFKSGKIKILVKIDAGGLLWSGKKKRYRYTGH